MEAVFRAYIGENRWVRGRSPESASFGWSPDIFVSWLCEEKYQALDVLASFSGEVWNVIFFRHFSHAK